MSKKYKFRKIYLHCTNGQAIPNNVQFSTFWRLKADAVSRFVYEGKHIQRTEKYQHETRIDKHTVEGFYLVHEALYHEILEKYDTKTSIDDYAEKLIDLLSKNKTWIDYGISASKIIKVGGDVVWVHLDELPKNYVTKYIYPNFALFVQYFFDQSKSFCTKDCPYRFNFIYQRKSHPRTFIFK